MTEERPNIPRRLRRAVLVEAGHRCAIPTCRATTTEIAHAVPWSEVREHTFDNLIVLCPNCHSRYDKGEIDRQSMLMYKRNLGVLTSRYSESERRLLEVFARSPGTRTLGLHHNMNFEFMYLLLDGVITTLPEQPGVVTLAGWTYTLTDLGVRLVDQLREGLPMDAGQPE
jgi:hypothetical protein